jgi:hypothetical protein
MHSGSEAGETKVTKLQLRLWGFVNRHTLVRG